MAGFLMREPKDKKRVLVVNYEFPEVGGVVQFGAKV